MIKIGEINPLAVHGLRQLTHCPPHFERVVFDLRVTKRDILDWINENLEGRFYIGIVDTKSDKSFSRQQCVAFEHGGETSYFSLMLSQINSMT